MRIDANATIDLNGHSLTISGAYGDGTITNSSVTGSYGTFKDILIENCELRRSPGAWRWDWRKSIPGVTNRYCGIAGLALEVVDGGRMENVTIRDPQATDNITSLGAWAWGLSRGLDLAFTIPELDATRSVATGCSRLAKTALLACARDERFAVCVPNQTGGGGCPLAKRDFGENVSTEMHAFTHWYCKAYGKYIDNEQAMKFDQHLLIASIAPRAILVEGFNDGWFDTKGEWLACRAASPAWEFLRLPGLPRGGFPANYSTAAIGPRLGYVRRGGNHGMTGYDWNWILDFSDNVFTCK